MKIYASHIDDVRNALSQFIGEDVWVKVYIGGCYTYWVKITYVSNLVVAGYVAQTNMRWSPQAGIDYYFDLHDSTQRVERFNLSHVEISDPLEVYTTDELFNDIRKPDYLD